MARILDTRQAADVAFAVTQVLESEGYTAEEAIPGLMQVIIEQAALTDDSEQALNEAVRLMEEE